MAAAANAAGQTFAERAAALFAGIGDANVAWQLEPEQGFRPGSGDAHGSSDDEDGLQPALADAGSDEDCEQEVEEYQRRASCAYRRAFEREADCDAWDMQAAGSAAEEPRPLRSMEVLDGNAFDRMHGRLRGDNTGTADGEHTASIVAVSDDTSGAAGAIAAAAAAGGEDVMDLDDDPCTQQKQHHHQQQQQQQQQQQGAAARPPSAKRQRPGFGEPWVPPHRRGDDMPVDEDAMQQDQQQQQLEPLPSQHGHDGRRPARRRVRFADDVCAVDCREAGSSCALPPQRHDRGGGGRRLPAGPGRGRGRAVPDHVAHPERWTVYALDTPLLVGGGGGDDDEQVAAVREAGAVAAALRTAAAAARPEPEQPSTTATPAALPAVGSIVFAPTPASKKGATHSTQAPPSAPVQQQQKQKQRARGAFADAEQDGIDEDEAAWQGAPPCQDMQLPPAGPPQAGPPGAGDDAAPASTSTRRAAVRRHMRTQQKQQHAPGGEDDTGEDGG